MNIKDLVLGNIVKSESPKGKLDSRNFVNIVWVGLLGCLPVFLNSISTQIPTLSWGDKGWMVPIILLIIKAISETMKGER